MFGNVGRVSPRHHSSGSEVVSNPPSIGFTHIDGDAPSAYHVLNTNIKPPCIIKPSIYSADIETIFNLMLCQNYRTRKVVEYQLFGSKYTR